jgi:hypothetical protein
MENYGTKLLSLPPALHDGYRCTMFSTLMWTFHPTGSIVHTRLDFRGFEYCHNPKAVEPWMELEDNQNYYVTY